VEYISPSPAPGSYTRRNYISYCINPVTGFPTDCADIVIHKFYVFDSNCPPPPNCPDNDNDGFTTCQGDCNDGDAYLNLRDMTVILIALVGAIVMMKRRRNIPDMVV
jgi:hypothetical protein